MNKSAFKIWKCRYSTQVIGTLFFTFAASVASAQTVIPSDVKPTCTVSASDFKSWFKTGSVSLNGEVKPANSLTFNAAGNCSFFQWSEQMYLWLTSPTPATYGGGNSRIFDSPVFFDVTAPDKNNKRHYVPHTAGPKLINVRSSQVGVNGLQLIFDNKGTMFEVVPAPIAKNGKSMILDSANKLVEIHRIEVGKDQKPIFFDENAKKIAMPERFKINTTMVERVAPNLKNLKAVATMNLAQGFRTGPNAPVVFVNSKGQIIPTQGQAGDNGVLLAQNNSLVYYATIVNDVFAYFQSSTPVPPAPATPPQFPTTQADLDPVIAYAQTKGVTFPDPEALAIEVKTAWIEPIAGIDTSKYITAIATVPVYDTSSNQMWVPIPNKTKKIPLIMVGMHVVGSAAGHPEMIWATFENLNNAPNAGYTYTNTAGQSVNVPQSSTGIWLFSSTNNPTATYNTERMSFQNPNIVANSPNTIGASDIIRWKAWGSASNAGSATSLNTEVISINNSVIGQLVAGDVRGNYIMTGATWTPGGIPANNSNGVGTSRLANTTMETFQQGTSSQAVGDSNCFTCHQNNTVAVSHIFSSLQPLP